jgi:hypothetical protein
VDGFVESMVLRSVELDVMFAVGLVDETKLEVLVPKAFEEMRCALSTVTCANTKEDGVRLEG